MFLKSENNPEFLLNTMRHLIQVRKSQPVFSLGEYKFLSKSHKECLILMRSHHRKHILCALNLSEASQSIQVNLAPYDAQSLYDLIKNKTYAQLDSDQIIINLKPLKFVWLELRS